MLATEPTAGPMCVAPLVQHLLATGESPREIEAALGVQPERLEQPSTRLPVARVFDFWASAARKLADPTLPAAFARDTTPESAHLLGFVAQTAPSVRDAVQALIDFGGLHTNSGSWVLDLGARTATLRWRRAGALSLGHRLCNEVVLTRYVGGLRCVVGEPALEVKVRMRHSPGAGTRALEDFFGSKLECGAAGDGFAFDRAVLDAVPRQANPELWRFVRGLAEAELRCIGPRSTVDLVREALRAALLRGDAALPTSAVLARGLGLGERTLRRKLAASGTSFQRLLDESRREHAEKLLEQRGRSILEVAFASGYSDTSAFDHAFRRWFGRSPRAHRRASSSS